MLRKREGLGRGNLDFQCLISTWPVSLLSRQNAAGWMSSDVDHPRKEGKGRKRGQVKIILDLFTALAHSREDIIQTEILWLQVTENPMQAG